MTAYARPTDTPPNGWVQPSPKAGPPPTGPSYPAARDAGRPVTRIHPAIRLLAVLAALAMTVLVASGMRVFDRELRADTRAASARVMPHLPAVGPSQEARAANDGAAPHRVALRLTPTPWVRPLRPGDDPEPQALAPGEHALGVSLPRRLRWAVLGGHGRHGVG